MSYKTEFASNNADLQTILDKVNSLPDAGGGSAPNTCTVVVDYPRCKAYSAVVYRNGAYIFECPESGITQEFIISDVVCGSVLAISSESEMLNDTNDETFITYYGNGDYWTHYFRIPKTAAGQTITFVV